MVKILQSDLIEHPAVQAWRELQPQRVEPLHIEILKHKKKGSVYRLAGVGPGASGLIAKRCQHEKAVIERTVYEEILPQLPVTTLHYYGSVEDRAGFCWIFLEDVGNQHYSPMSMEHRKVAAQWLGAMHTAAECIIAKDTLPNRGPDYYLMYLRSAQEMIPQIRIISSLEESDRTLLKKILSMCKFLEAQWGYVEKLCEPLPLTFIHGDCLVKNVHMRMTEAGLAFTPFDWGGAGWGLPATDLGQLGLPYRSVPQTDPDYLAYAHAVRGQWPRFDLETVQQLANLGQIFWSLKVISRGVPEFDDERTHLDSLTSNFTIYADVLARAIGAIRWNR